MPKRKIPASKAREKRYRSGRVVADFGRHVLVEDDDNEIHPCTLRGRLRSTACGDRVFWQPGPHGGRGVVEERLPRVSELTRPDSRGRPDVLAANIDQIVVVCALAPPFDPNITDRYLAAAAFMDVNAIIVCNKIELVADITSDPSDAILREYESIPYTVARTSVKTGAGLDHLAELAAGHTSIFVGLSGVGKSSLLNALRPETEAPVGALSVGSGEGTHTTRASRLYKLPRGGEVIDSPGVREYTPQMESTQDPVAAFKEFHEPSTECRFRNCRHLNEPNCGVKDAIAAGRISERRYASYLRLLENADGIHRPACRTGA